MESALLCCHYCPLPKLNPHLCSTRVFTRASKPHISSHHNSLLLSNGCRQLKRVVHRPVTCTIDNGSFMPSTDDEDNGDAMPPFVAIGAMAALKSLLDVGALISSSNGYSCPQPEITAPPQMVKAMQMMKSRENSEAVEFLRKEYEELKKDNDPYPVAMALAELLIWQGRYKEALECDGLNTNVLARKSDGRFYLYKAIIYTMLNEAEKANVWWTKVINYVIGIPMNIPIE